MARAGLVPSSFRGAFWLMMAYDATPELLSLQQEAVRHSVESGVYVFMAGVCVCVRVCEYMFVVSVHGSGGRLRRLVGWLVESGL